jgi:hypothetical protein
LARWADGVTGDESPEIDQFERIAQLRNVALERTERLSC